MKYPYIKYKSKNPNEVADLIFDYNIPEEILNISVDHEDIAVVGCMAFNPSTPAYIITKIYEKNIEELMPIIARNENTEIFILEKLSNDLNYETRISAKNNLRYRKWRI